METKGNSKPSAKKEKGEPKCDWDFDKEYIVCRSYNVALIGTKILFERAEEGDDKAMCRLREISEIIIQSAGSDLLDYDLEGARKSRTPKVYGPNICL